MDMGNRAVVSFGGHFSAEEEQRIRAGIDEALLHRTGRWEFRVYHIDLDYQFVVSKPEGVKPPTFRVSGMASSREIAQIMVYLPPEGSAVERS